MARLDVPLGETVRVPDSSAPLWCQVELRPSVRGRLRNVVLRPSRVLMEYTTADGTRSAFVVPAMMSSGFLLSPAVRTTAAFAILTTHGVVPPDGRVRTIRLIPELEGNFEQRVRVQFARVAEISEVSSGTEPRQVPLTP